MLVYTLPRLYTFYTPEQVHVLGRLDDYLPPWSGIGSTLNEISCFIMQWNGKESNKDERAKAAEFILSMKVIALYL